MKQRSALKTSNCRKASLKHGMYSATMFSARAYLRTLEHLCERTTLISNQGDRQRHEVRSAATSGCQSLELPPVVEATTLTSGNRPKSRRCSEHQLRSPFEEIFPCPKQGHNQTQSALRPPCRAGDQNG